jgi:hypothetical protein
MTQITEITVEEFRFHINVPFKPETMPMARLVEYLAQLVALLGEAKRVHLTGIGTGSTVPALMVEDEALSRVEERVVQAQKGHGDPEAIKAFQLINRKLQQDDGDATITRRSGQLIYFPGKQLVEDITFKAVQEDSFDGIVIRIGGRNEFVPVPLQAGELTYNCLASRDIARQLAQHIFTTQVRVYGEAHWNRNEVGNWHLERFQIRHFEPLNDEPLSAAVERLRAVPGSGWVTVEHPWLELEELRNGPRASKS